jgi:ubiquilin
MMGGGLGGMGGMGGFPGMGGGLGGQAGGQQPDLDALLQQLGGGQGGLPGNPQGGLGGFGGGLGGNPYAAFMPPPAQVNPALPPEQRYADQLQQMSDMGFTNKDLNIQMLDQTGGNVQLAIERLLGFLG